MSNGERDRASDNHPLVQALRAVNQSSDTLVQAQAALRALQLASRSDLLDQPIQDAVSFLADAVLDEVASAVASIEQASATLRGLAGYPR